LNVFMKLGTVQETLVKGNVPSPRTAQGHGSMTFAGGSAAPPGAAAQRTEENAVGWRIWFSTRATMAPSRSVSARLASHSGSAAKAPQRVSRSASYSLSSW
jgi:hypothetical protein